MSLTFSTSKETTPAPDQQGTPPAPVKACPITGMAILAELKELGTEEVEALAVIIQSPDPLPPPFDVLESVRQSAKVFVNLFLIFSKFSLPRVMDTVAKAKAAAAASATK